MIRLEPFREPGSVPAKPVGSLGSLSGPRVAGGLAVGRPTATSRISAAPDRQIAGDSRPPNAAVILLELLRREPELLEVCAVDGRLPWFVADVQVRQVFSHGGKAFVRSDLWNPEQWPDPDAVRSPSKSIAGSAADERRRESDVRREVEASYEPVVLYGDSVREEPA
jgi:hypothetical protein